MSTEVRGNGDRFNRNVKASAAYAEMIHEVQLLHFKLFGDENDGAIPKLSASMERLEANPMIQFGYFLRGGKRAAVAFGAFLAACASIVVGVLAVANALGIPHP